MLFLRGNGVGALSLQKVDVISNVPNRVKLKLLPSSTEVYILFSILFSKQINTSSENFTEFSSGNV